MSMDLFKKSGYPKFANMMRGLVPTIKTLGFISTENSGGIKASNENNVIADRNLERNIKQGGLGCIKVLGKYGLEENTFLIPNISKDELFFFGKEYKQETVIFGEKMVDPDIQNGFKFELINTAESNFGLAQSTMYIFSGLDDDIENYYSELKGKKFFIPFFDNDAKNLKFELDKGIIDGGSINESVIETINSINDICLENNRTLKSRAINRHYMNKLIKENLKTR